MISLLETRAELRKLLWTGGEGISLPGMLAVGAVLWVLFCALQLASDGVVLDEVVEPAQIIVGAVHYPPGHPHEVFYNHVYSLPNFLWAALWKLAPNAEIVSATRDFLFVFLSVFVPFAFATVLTRQPLWGHFAAVLTVTEAGLKIKGVYPLWVFPNFYSHGQIGLELGALAAALLLAGCWRTGGFLLGLLPGVHAAMTLVVWPWSALYFLFSSARPEGQNRRRLVTAAATGLGICAAFAVFLVTRGVSAVQPPYDAGTNGQVILQNFTAFSDYHRRPFEIFTYGYCVNLVAFFTLGALLWRATWRQRGQGSGNASRSTLLPVLLLGSVAWAWVYGTRLIDLLLGASPLVLEPVMPYRFSNFSSILLLPLTAAALAATLDAASEVRRESAFALLMLVLGAAGLLQVFEGISFSWNQPGHTANHLLFVVWGLLCAVDLTVYWKLPQERRWSLAAALFLAGSMILSEPRYKVFSFVAGFVLAAALLGPAGWALRRCKTGKPGRAFSDATLASVFVFLCLAALPGYRLDPFGWDRLTLIDLDLKNWLDKNAARNELILTPIFPRAELQAKTGHPVLMEIETTYLMTYMPRLAPVVGKMMSDLYGIDYSNSKSLYSLASEGKVELTEVWIDCWKNRTLDEWEVLGRRYGFRFVLSLRKAPLNLPEVFRSGVWRLYRIPEIDAAGHGNAGAATAKSARPVVDQE